MRNLIKEPLLHIVIIGCLLFVLDTLVQEETINRNKIVINEGRIEHLSAVFERRWQRPPSVAEMRQLVENYVREEILYREAQILGLDRNDTVIRRRLRMKMELATRDVVDTLTPSEYTLQQYLEQHKHKYQRPAQFSFRQLHFQTSNRPEDLAEALQQLNQGTAENLEGDSSLLPERMTNEVSRRINQVFGAHFSSQLTKAPTGHWAGPLESAYGKHLVFIEDYQPARAAQLSEVRGQVLRDWQIQERETRLEHQYQQYRNNYTVLIESPVPASWQALAQQ
ncbi:peptidyl-prolyl cis-trans isomerase [Microbulbifer epialgicus]|uniref:Peptidyl-prolyl cis-trans isomerase n=1 Tax=Microbulbifer epialgicus TaxID=393907 RepID=A0ABV4P0N2_9GAMM